MIPEHTRKLYEAYAGEKKIKIIDDPGQGHNSNRPKYIRDSIAIFFYETLQVQHLVKQPSKESEAAGESLPEFKPSKKAQSHHEY